MITTANLIKEDIKLLVSTLDIDEADEIKIYVLEETIAGGSYSKNNNVFCSKEDLINGNYRLALIQSYLNLSEPWMMYGNTVRFLRKMQIMQSLMTFIQTMTT